MTTETNPAQNPHFVKYLVEGFGAVESLPGLKKDIVEVAEELKKQGDPSASVFRYIQLEMGAYLPGVSYVLLFGRRVDPTVPNAEYKSVALKVTTDSFVTVQKSSGNGMQPVEGHDFEHLRGHAVKVPVGLRKAVQEAEYPYAGAHLAATHQSLSSVVATRETRLRGRDGKETDITMGMITRIF